MLYDEQGKVLAHRLLLGYLLQVVRQMAPAEGDERTIEATLLTLRQSLPPMTVGMPPLQQAWVEEAAAHELERILLRGAANDR